MRGTTMNAFERSESPNIISAAITISDMTKMLEKRNQDNSAESHWRWSLLELAADELQIIQLDSPVSNHKIWRADARLRATGMLELALVDSFQLSTLRLPNRQLRWDQARLERLGHCYRSLHEVQSRGARECETVLRETFLGLVAAYRPATRHFDVQIALTRLQLPDDQRRALVLLMSCLVQNAFQLALRTGRGGSLSLTLSDLDDLSASLVLQTSIPLPDIFESPAYSIATRMASILQAEFNCRQGGSNGSIFELQFARPSLRLDPKVAAGSRIRACQTHSLPLNDS